MIVNLEVPQRNHLKQSKQTAVWKSSCRECFLNEKEDYIEYLYELQEVN